MDRHTPEYLTKLGIERVSPMRAIRMHCCACQGGEPGTVARGEVRKAIMDCASVNCALYAFRGGINRWRDKRELTDEQREELRRRGQALAAMRGGDSDDEDEDEGDDILVD